MDRIESRRKFLLSSLALAFTPAHRLWAAGNCMTGVTNILGPAYRKDAPFRSRLCDVDEPGTPLQMRGRIIDAATCTALAGGVLDVWQVNNAGDYDMHSPAFQLRGRIKAGSAGDYAFDTIMPVPYGMRPKHIHFLVTRSGYEPRISQCYFAGDERNAKDPYVKKDLIVAPQPRRGAGRADALSAVFDIALDRERPPPADARKIYSDYVGTYQVAPGIMILVRTEGAKLFWHLSAAGNEGDALDGEFLPRAQGRFFVPEYDFEVKFVRDDHGHVDHVLDSRGLLFKKLS
ncbi:MAG: DUF3471 domain-containing protein [Gammaproteobacteria bacterium]|nr:MAG: DUF3471 domain-containing protein [Gammaproteobacteria bacterium]